MSAIQSTSDAPDAQVDPASPPRNEVFDFMGLPGEIRNMIYPLLLHGTSQQDYTWSGYEVCWPPEPLKRPIEGLFLPFTHWVFTFDGDTDINIMCPEGSEGRALMEAPSILAVNRQIRAEARSLFLRKYLTLELHGIGGVWEDKLKTLRHWLKSLTSDEIGSIERIELREKVEIVRPDHSDEIRKWGITGEFPARMPTECYQEGNWEHEAIRVQIAAVEIKVENHGKTLEMRSRLEIIEKEKVPVRGYLQRMVEEKREARELFTEHNLISLTCWLKVTDEIPRRKRVCHYNTIEEYKTRWIMLGSEKELKWPEPRRWSGLGEGLELGFRHLVARVDI